MCCLKKIWHTIRNSALRVRGIELRDINNNRQNHDMEMSSPEDGKIRIKDARENQIVVTEMVTSQVPGSPKTTALQSGPREEYCIRALLPQEVALRHLDDTHDPELSAVALAASPAWEHLDPALIRPMLAKQAWPRQMYITQICDIVYCRVTGECYVRWLPIEPTPRSIKLVPAHTGDEDEDNWDASFGPFTPPRPPACRRWHRKYPVTEIPVPTQDFRWGRRHAGRPSSCIGSQAESCDWVLSRTPDLENQGPALMVTMPEGDEFFLVPPQNATDSDSPSCD